MHDLDVAFLKRVFPLFSTTIVVCLAVLGHLFAPSCLSGFIGSSPVWFWVNYQIVFYPFIVLWPATPTISGKTSDVPFSLTSFGLLSLLLSILLSLVEVGTIALSGSRSVGWAAGYSLHVLTLLLLVLYHRHERRKEMEIIDTEAGRYGPFLAWVVTCISVIFSLLSSWDYDATRNNFFQGVVIYLLLPVQGLVLCFDHQNLKFSHAYCVFYAVLGMRIPDFLAFGSVRLFASLGASSSWLSTVADSTDAIRYIVSVGYLMFMGLYLRLLKIVIESMSAPNTFPRFMYHAQFYCYSCYYILVSTARRLDALFFFNLILMNVYYVLNNTGTLSDWMDRWVWSRCESRVPTYSYNEEEETAVLGSDDDDEFGPSKRRRRTTSTPRNLKSPSKGDEEDSFSSSSDRKRLISVAFRMKFAEQDHLADSTALLAIPTLITVFASLAARDALGVANQLSASEDNLEVLIIRVEHYDGAPLDLLNLWLRFGIMFLARWVSAYISRYVFTCKIQGSVFYRSYLLQQRPSSSSSSNAFGSKATGGDVVNEVTKVEEEDERLPLRSPSPSVSGSVPSRRLSGSINNQSGAAPLQGFPVSLLTTPTMATATVPVFPENVDFFLDASLRRALLGLDIPSPIAVSGRGSSDVSVEHFHNSVLSKEFPNVLPYFVLVSVHSLYSLFQNPDLPTRYAFCAFTSLHGQE